MTDPAPVPGGGAAELAVPLSVAVRIEPELIRAIRLAVLPHLDVSAESDLWFADDLVASRGPDTIVLRPEVLPGLRAELAARLAGSGGDDPIRSVGRITSRIHASDSPALVLEERVTWLAVAHDEDARAAIEEELGSALRALVKGGRTGIANWLAGAWPRLPEAVRGTKTAWQLRQAASVHAEIGRLPSEVVPAGLGVADLAELAIGFDRDADVAVPVRLADGLLELGAIGSLPGAAAVPLIDTDPRIVELLPDDEDAPGTTIAVPRGGQVSVAAGPGPARLLTPRGLVYEVTPYVPPRMYVPLAGSQRQPLPGAYPAGPLDLSEPAAVTVVLRRRAPLPEELMTGPVQLSRGELAARYGADQADVALVTEVLTAYGLAVWTTVDDGSRRASIEGDLGTLVEAFGADLSLVSSEHPDGTGRATHRYRTGPLHIPAELDGVVTAVLGLDERPQARPCVRVSEVGSAVPSTIRFLLNPWEMGLIYEFPQGANGSGQTIAILEFGAEFSQDQADRYFAFLKTGRPSLLKVSVQGAASVPVVKDQLGGDAPFSAMASVAMAGVLAPGAAQLVYYAPNTERGFFDAISDAVYATAVPTVVSIGWGEAEDSWTPQARVAINEVLADAAALGVTVCVAAGDHGSGSARSDAQSRVYFPASSPYALACGGTSLVTERATEGGTSEVVWPGTGGGVSDVFALPPWQASAGIPPQIDGGGFGRGVPDVAANADPASGYPILDSQDPAGFGGTATVAALWSALVCLLAQATGSRLGFLQPLLYEGISPGITPPGFRAITQGNNGAYRAGPGWNACTGLGSPNGGELLQRLTGATGRSG
jgi:kumamolisin